MVDISLPVIIPDRLLISPGNWNDNEYSAQELSDAFAKTKWEDKSKISLWLNHDDGDANAFVGYVKNPKLASKGRIFGDLELWDEKTAMILTQAMAKFGVSAKIKGNEDKKTGKMENFTFENFSIVTVPACSDAYINLSKEKQISKYLTADLDQELARGEGQGVGGEKQGDGGADYCYCPKCSYKAKHEKGTPCSELKCPKCGATMTGDKSLSYTVERGLKNMAEKEEKKEEEKVEVEKENQEKELSEKEMLKELSVKFDKLITLLSEKKLQDEPEVEAEEKPEEKVEVAEEKAEEEPAAESEEVEKENKELVEAKKEVKELKERLNAPKSKTIRNLSSNTVGNDVAFSREEFADLLTGIDSPMKII